MLKIIGYIVLILCGANREFKMFSRVCLLDQLMTIQSPAEHFTKCYYLIAASFLLNSGHWFMVRTKLILEKEGELLAVISSAASAGFGSY